MIRILLNRRKIEGRLKDMKKINYGKADFMIEIRYMEHSSWQGTVKWLGGEREECFRSTLELLKIMESVEHEVAMASAVPEEEGNLRRIVF